MAAVIPLMAWVYARRLSRQGAAAGARASAWKLFPVFILGFIAMAIFRSVGDAGVQSGAVALGFLSKADWSRSIALLSDAAGYALAMAMAGVGLGTRFKTLKGLGIKPFYVGLVASLVVGVASALSVFLLGGYVQF